MSIRIFFGWPLAQHYSRRDAAEMRLANEKIAGKGAGATESSRGGVELDAAAGHGGVSLAFAGEHDD